MEIKQYNRELAETMAAALAAECGWQVGPVEVQANGEIGFWVVVPARPPTRTTRGHGAQRQIRTFSGAGEMSVERVECKVRP